MDRLKVCPNCEIEKTVAEFYKAKGRKDGLQAYCKLCHREKQKACDAKHQDKRKQYYKQYGKENRERLHEYKVQWRKDNPEKEAQYRKTAFEKDPERLRGYLREWRARNIEKVRESDRQAAAVKRAENPEKCKEINKRWRLKNPLYIKQKNMARIAAKKKATVGEVDYNYILQRDKRVCHICGVGVGQEELHFDHIIPISRGGSHENSNIAVSHAFCNLSKHNLLLDEYYEQRGVRVNA